MGTGRAYLAVDILQSLGIFLPAVLFVCVVSVSWKRSGLGKVRRVFLVEVFFCALPQGLQSMPSG